MRWSYVLLVLIATVVTTLPGAAIELVFETPIVGNRTLPVTVTLNDLPDGDAVDITVSIPSGSASILGLFANIAGDAFGSDADLIADMTVQDLSGHLRRQRLAANGVTFVGFGNHVLPIRDWDLGLRFGLGFLPIESVRFRLIGPGLTTERLIDASNGGWLLGVRLRGVFGAPWPRSIGLADTLPRLVIDRPEANSFVADPATTLNGTVTGAPSTVRVQGNEIPLDADGGFQTPLTLTEGLNRIDVIAKGVTAIVRQTRDFTLDTVLPSVTLTNPIDGTRTGAPSIEITGQVDDTTPIALVAINGSPIELVDGTFTGSLDLGLGETVVLATATDAAGNVGDATVTVERGTPPTVIVDTPSTNEVVRVPEIRVRGRADDATTVTVQGQPAPLQDDRFDVGVPLAVGSQSVTLSATNDFGTSAVSITVERRSLPTIAITEPNSLTRIGDPTVLVRGTVSPANSSVTVAGVEATLTPDGSGTHTDSALFEATVTLHEGTNIIAAVATDTFGEEAATTVAVARDATPPRVTITSPRANNAGLVEVHEPAAIITGFVQDLGLDQPTTGPVVEVNGAAAVVDGQSWIATVPLTPGTNVVTATATDDLGNGATASLTVEHRLLDDVARVRSVAGNLQSGGVAQALGNPLVVETLDAGGQPVADAVVVFQVVGDGTVEADGVRDRAVPVLTDAAGRATCTWHLGVRSGSGAQQVVATATGFAGRVVFNANVQPGSPARIVVEQGEHQHGTAGAPLARPLVVALLDVGGNRLAGRPVTFTVVGGGGVIESMDGGNGTERVVTTDANGSAAVQLVLGLDDGPSAQRVRADFAGNASPPVIFAATAVTPGSPAETRVSGVVHDNTGTPIPGVTARLDGTDLSTATDEEGQFVITGAPTGPVHLIVDGTTATRPGPWPSLAYELDNVAGRDNTVGPPIHLPRIDFDNGLDVDAVSGGTVTLPQLPGFRLIVAPGSARFPDGSRAGRVSVSLVNDDRVPMPPNLGVQPRMVLTIQPSGTLFDPPARIEMPNVDGLAAGTGGELLSFDHDLAQFVSIGSVTVSEDESTIESDPGIGIVEGGWHHPAFNNARGFGGGGDPFTDPTTLCECPTCKTCDESIGACVPSPPGTSCDDGLFCTSASGLAPGPDTCNGATCSAKTIKGRALDITPIDLDLTALKGAITGAAEALKFGPCDISTPSIGGGIKGTFEEACCESSSSLVEDTKFSGFVSAGIAGIECPVPGLSFNALGLFEAGVVVGVGAQGSFTGTGTQSECDGTCSVSVQGQLQASLFGGLRAVTKIDPDFLTVRAVVKGSGSVSFTLDACGGGVTGEGCIGPPSISGEAVLKGFIKKSIEITFNDLQVCIP